jgi:hypothetical protein
VCSTTGNEHRQEKELPIDLHQVGCTNLIALKVALLLRAEISDLKNLSIADRASLVLHPLSGCAALQLRVESPAL